MADEPQADAPAESAPESEGTTLRPQPVKVDLPDGGSVSVSYTPPAKVEPPQPQDSPPADG